MTHFQQLNILRRLNFNSDVTHRKAKKRGEKDKKRGISNLKIAVVVAQDRNGSVIARKAGTGRVKAEEIDTVIGEYIHPFVIGFSAR